MLCSEAFEEYSKGNIEKHNEILVDAIDKLSEEVDCIVMAQLFDVSFGTVSERHEGSGIQQRRGPGFLRGTRDAGSDVKCKGV